jgi:hypothetical protein
MLHSLRWQSGTKDVREVWPELSAVIVTGRCAPVRESIAQTFALEFGGVEVREACSPLEGPLAVEDHRHGGLRVLGDLGSFYEFVPVEELNNSEPARHTLREVEPGQAYATAFTSPAGLWSCLSGLRVTFERREPWLLRQVTQEAVTIPKSLECGPGAPGPPSRGEGAALGSLTFARGGRTPRNLSTAKKRR